MTQSRRLLKAGKRNGTGRVDIYLHIRKDQAVIVKDGEVIAEFMGLPVPNDPERHVNRSRRVYSGDSRVLAYASLGGIRAARAVRNSGREALKRLPTKQT